MSKTITVRPGDIPGIGSLFVTIEWNGLRLSITGVAGPVANGRAAREGQCLDALDEVAAWAKGWDAEKGARLKGLWARWHLNDMRAGSRAQEDWLRANPVTATYPESHYDKAFAALDEAGLNPDAEGYRYGHAWKFEDVPAEVVEELFALPIADRPLPGAWAY
jgi:hypothetical protein